MHVAIFLPEAFDATGRVDDLLLARVKRVAFRADFDVQRAARSRAGLEVVATTASDVDLDVIRMDFLFHGLFLGENCPAYVKKFKISPYEAIGLIKQAGGIAVLAHPMVTNKDELIPSFVLGGLQGIEVYYPHYSEATIQYYGGIAKKHQLIPTGGSDDHGKAKANTFIGKIKIPYEIVERLKELRKKS